MLHVVTDFDGTLMNEDVGALIIRELDVVKEEGVQEAIRLIRGGESGSMAWIRMAFPYLKGRKDDVDRVLRQVRPRDGAHAFLDFCASNGIPVTILSDGMVYYIDELVRQHGLQVDRVISNPIRYEADGSYTVGAENKNPACSWCGCCKAMAVRELKEAGHQVLYIGDGMSDFYGSGFADWVFARASLARNLTESGELFFPFETFHDVLSVLEPRLEDFRSGMGARTNQAHPFCKF